MSTREAMAARCTSKPESSSSEARKARSLRLRLAKKRKHMADMTITARADGSREVNSVTSPVGRESAAMHQWKKGGL